MQNDLFHKFKDIKGFRLLEYDKGLQLLHSIMALSLSYPSYKIHHYLQ